MSSFLDITEYTEPLARTPAILRAVIEGRPDAWLDSRHAPDVVSPRETVVHLLYCERESAVARVRYIIESSLGNACEIEEMDLGLSGLSMAELLDMFDAERATSLKDFADLHLTPADLEHRIDDDELGTMTVANALATWVAHDLYHLGQIFKSFSALYIDRVGPFQHFLNLPHFN